MISRSLSPEATSTLSLVHALTSRFDYCSAINDGVLANEILLLNRVLCNESALWAAFLNLARLQSMCEIPFSPFLDPRSLLISCFPTEPYQSLHHIFGMTYHLNSAPFLRLHHRHCQSQDIIFIRHPQGLPLKIKISSLQTLLP